MKNQLRIKLPKSMRNLMIGNDKISEDFGLSTDSKPKIIIVDELTSTNTNQTFMPIEPKFRVFKGD